MVVYPVQSRFLAAPDIRQAPIVSVERVFHTNVPTE